MIFVVTIVGPIGAEIKSAIIIPKNAHITEIIAEQITTALKFLKTRIADSAGKIISAEINKEPTRFIARTIIIAIVIAKRVL